MLDCQENYTRQENYTFSETKPTVLVSGNKKTHKYMFNDTIQQSETTTYLGINRDSKSRFDSIMVFRNDLVLPVEQLMLWWEQNYGAYCLSLYATIHLICIYIVPRLTYTRKVIRLVQRIWLILVNITSVLLNKIRTYQIRILIWLSLLFATRRTTNTRGDSQDIYHLWKHY